MSLISEIQLEATVNRLQKEMNDKLASEVTRLSAEITKVQSVATGGTTTPGTGKPVIINMTRNSDFRSSVDGWFNATSVADNQRYECANVYVYQPFEPVLISDAQIDAGTNVLKALTSLPFTAGMVGRRVVIEGAGASGSIFGAKIDSFTNSGEVVLSANAVTTVATAKARLNLQKLTHKNSKNSPADTVNDALKDAQHTHYGTNIQDPDWDLVNGIGRMGSKHVVGFPFGYFSQSDGTTYVPLHQLFSGRIVFARINIAKANAFVKIKGRFFIGIYNNSDLVLDWVKGNKFEVTSTVLGSPATTTTAEYLVVIETDSGFSIVSDIITVADAPDNAAFNAGARVRLNWTRFAGATVTTIYRKLTGENVFRLEADVFEREYLDVNNPTRQDVGASFPTIINGQDTIASYFATPPNLLDELPNNGAGEPYQPLEVFLPFPPSVNMGLLFDPHLIIGFTEALATEVTDAVADGAGNITSVSGAFTAGMVGKAYTLYHQPTNQTATGTVSGFTSANQISLSSSPFGAAGCILEIEDSQPHGLFFDLIGSALTEVSSEWGYHADDDKAKQPGVSNPNGSSQGGTSGSDGNGGGTGVISCVLDEVLIFVRGIDNDHIVEKRADQVLLSDLLWNGEGFTDNDFNEIAWIKTAIVDEIIRVKTETKELPCTKFHRLVDSEENAVAGKAVKNFRVGNKTLISDGNSSRMELITAMPVEKGKFKVVSFGLKNKNQRNQHLFVSNKFKSHNRKSDEELNNLLL